MAPVFFAVCRPLSTSSSVLLRPQEISQVSSSVLPGYRKGSITWPVTRDSLELNIVNRLDRIQTSRSQSRKMCFRVALRGLIDCKILPFAYFLNFISKKNVLVKIIHTMKCMKHILPLFCSTVTTMCITNALNDMNYLLGLNNNWRIYSTATC